jgi:enoyl-CoA hydratase
VEEPVGYENLVVEEREQAVRVTVNRPQALNALNRTTLEELHQVADALARRPEVRVVVITGAGDKAFVAGADIKGMIDLGPEEGAAFAAIGHRLADAIAAAPQIWIAAVNGFALGGGCELALCCDFAWASDRARFGQPEVNLGVIPGFGGTSRLARRVGVARAIEMVTTGNLMSAAEALAIGLINRVVPHATLLDEVDAVARTIASKGPLAVSRAKQSLRASQELPLSQHNALEIRLFGECFATADQKEGMAAFVEKRPAVFKGV